MGLGFRVYMGLGFRVYMGLGLGPFTNPLHYMELQPAEASMCFDSRNHRPPPNPHRKLQRPSL